MRYIRHILHILHLLHLAYLRRRNGGWDVRYSAVVLPQEANPAWDIDAPFNTAEIVDGKLHLISDDYACYFRNSDNFKNNIGITIETRLKVINVDDLCLTIDIGDSDRHCGLIFEEDKVRLIESGGISLLYEIDTTNDYHVYRVTLKGNNIKLYIDGILRLEGILSDPYAGGGAIFFYAGYDGLNSESYWDYIYYRVDGAFAP
jgi:hypothetical protein